MTKAALAAILAAAIITGCASASGKPSLLHPATLHAKARATFKAAFKTTKGTFVVKVNRSWAPKGADRFYNLVKYHFYDNQPLFRVAKDRHGNPFVTQWGISMTPAIAKAWQNANIKDDPVKHTNAKGTITFATAGPNTRTTQVFVNTGAKNAFLDSQGFAPFGTVVSGFSVFKKLYSGYGDGPNQTAMTDLGAKWVRNHYPKLDWITSARLTK